MVRAVLRNPALRRVQVAFLLFNSMEFGTWVAILLYAYVVIGPATVGLVALAQLLPAALFAPIGASFADRFPRDRVLLAGYLAQASALAVTGAGMITGSHPAIVIVAAAAAACAFTFTRPAQGSLLPRLSRTPEELTAANGLSGTVEGAGVLLGPLVAAGILAVSVPGAVLLAGASACALAALLVLRLPQPATPIAARALDVTLAAPARASSGGPGSSVAAAVTADLPSLVGDAHAGVMAGLRVLASHADTRLVVALLALRMLTSGAMDVLFVFLALEVFHSGESGAGILNAGLGLGTVLGGAATFALVGRQRLAPAIAVSALVWGGAILLVGTIAPAWAAPAVIAMGGVGYVICDVAGRTILQRVTPDRMLARVLGGLEGIGLFGLAIGAVVVPSAVGALGIQATLVAVGLVLPAGVAIAWTSLRSMDRRIRVPIREIALLQTTPVFAPLPPPQLEAVARRTRWITLEAGGVLIREGDVGDRYYVVESGILRVTSGDRFLRNTDGPGEGLGEIALLNQVPRTATVTALEPCVLLALERADFLEAVTGHAQVHEIAERVAAERSTFPPTS